MHQLGRGKTIVQFHQVYIPGADAGLFIGVLGAQAGSGEKSGMASCRAMNGLEPISEARTLTARSIRPRRFVVASDASTAAAELSTLMEHINFVFGHEIISAPMSSSRGVSTRYMDFGFMVEW